MCQYIVAIQLLIKVKETTFTITSYLCQKSTSFKFLAIQILLTNLYQNSRTRLKYIFERQQIKNRVTIVIGNNNKYANKNYIDFTLFERKSLLLPPKLTIAQSQPTTSNMSHQAKHLYTEQQLKNTITLYESFTTDVQSSLISESQLLQKGQKILQWLNDLIASKILKINQISSCSIQIFNHIIKEQAETSSKILQLEHNCIEKNTLIQNHLYTIKNIQNKLFQRENDIYKLKQQNLQLAEKIQNEENKFKRETKQFKKTFRQIQENTESEKQIFDSIQLDYEYQKQQNEILESELQTIKQQRALLKKQLEQTKRLLHAAQNKIQWEIKKKLPLEDTIKQQKLTIQRLFAEIEDLKQAIKDPYYGADHDHLQQKQADQTQYHRSFVEKNILSDEISLRQSFSELDTDEFIRKNSMRKSFDQNNVQQPSDTNMNYLTTTTYQNQHYVQNYMRKDSVQQYKTTNNAPSGINTIKVDSQQRNSILIKEMETSPTASPYSGSEKTQERIPSVTNSPEIRHFQTSNTMFEKQHEVSIISEKVKSVSSIQHFRKYVPDLYFAHFLLTSQAVKIKEDCEQMLSIDVKRYYQQIIDQRIPMHIWDEWIRDKLRSATQSIKNKHQSQSINTITSSLRR